MSKEREELVIPAANASETTNEDEKRRARAELKARLVTVLERGVVHDRLYVPLPDDVHGEWVRNDPLEIARMKVMGFQIDHEYAPKRALHSDGSGAAIVGDVVHMTCPKIIKETIDEIRHEQFLRINAPGKSKEEEEYIANTFDRKKDGVPPFSESKTYTASEEDIRDAVKEALTRAAAQTQPAPA